MAARKHDKNDFQARIKKIKNPRNTTYYDPTLGAAIPKRMKRKRVKTKNIEDTIVSAFLVSMIFGAVGLVLGQMVRVRFFGMQELGMAAFLLDVVVGTWAILMITAMTDKRRLSERFAQFLGVVLMLTAGHNLFWRFPDEMGRIYTPEYVEQVIETVPENSLVFRGRAYSL